MRELSESLLENAGIIGQRWIVHWFIGQMYILARRLVISLLLHLK